MTIILENKDISLAAKDLGRICFCNFVDTTAHEIVVAERYIAQRKDVKMKMNEAWASFSC